MDKQKIKIIRKNDEYSAEIGTGRSAGTYYYVARYQKSGSTANIREFRRAVKSLADSHQLPDYSLTYDSKKDMVQIVNKTAIVKKIRSKNGDCIHQ